MSSQWTCLMFVFVFYNINSLTGHADKLRHIAFLSFDDHCREENEKTNTSFFGPTYMQQHEIIIAVLTVDFHLII